MGGQTIDRLQGAMLLSSQARNVPYCLFVVDNHPRCARSGLNVARRLLWTKDVDTHCPQLWKVAFICCLCTQVLILFIQKLHQGARFYYKHGATLHLFVILFPVQYMEKRFALETRETMTTQVQENGRG